MRNGCVSCMGMLGLQVLVIFGLVAAFQVNPNLAPRNLLNIRTPTSCLTYGPVPSRSSIFVTTTKALGRCGGIAQTTASHSVTGSDLGLLPHRSLSTHFRNSPN